MRILPPFGASVAHVFTSEHDTSARYNTDKKVGGRTCEKSVSARCNVEKQRWDDFERFPDVILLWSAIVASYLHHRYSFSRRDDGRPRGASRYCAGGSGLTGLKTTSSDLDPKCMK